MVYSLYDLVGIKLFRYFNLLLGKTPLAASYPSATLYNIQKFIS